MHHSNLAPVFTGLRYGLHALVLGLLIFAIAQSFIVDSGLKWWVLLTGVTFLATYASAPRVINRAGNGTSKIGTTSKTGSTSKPGGALDRPGIWWIVALTCEWALLTWLSPEAAFMVFPMFFLYLHVIPGIGGAIAIVLATIFAIVALGLHSSFTIGGVIGPIIGAGVALLIGLAYRALQREAKEREELLAELLSTRKQLAETEREQGALAERARLARDIHDTVAQGLSSIHMLLTAAERDSKGEALNYITLARDTAATSLADTRHIIAELTPPQLDSGLAPALRRLAKEQSDRNAFTIDVEAAEVVLPMAEQTALFRIAQGALSNAIQHSTGQRIAVSLEQAAESVVLRVADDGTGFDPDLVGEGSHEGKSPTGSFGLTAIRQRVEEFNGTVEIETNLGSGTTVTVSLPHGEVAP